ncbi:predicted protein [Chaetomium globosum CBS 148.51]|uniref:Uncharacterized protein n=1 Tax=Chaetomium globosum (strain ATCC 6205 / CBS 148.51 / DSM 1962 / NBRC 6347 / NRRL 1970) TaxID=306901 RepID=Q2H3S3_CHAGB|nr:uncharacterized protein CHGG_06692 [Chaetomium globosum CBS 148.51]EAQ90073.1 predicted protein [Chaetomium globosum CBS 148.51]
MPDGRQFKLRVHATQIWGSMGLGIFSLIAATEKFAQHSTPFRCKLRAFWTGRVVATGMNQTTCSIKRRGHIPYRL